jgi:hypothetical protein
MACSATDLALALATYYLLDRKRSKLFVLREKLKIDNLKEKIQECINQ